MAEEVSYEAILKRMLQKVPDRFDKREGSIIMNALAPAAAELLLCYLALEHVLKESFADTGSRTYLVRRAAERGLYPKLASCAQLRAEFDTAVPIGTRFGAGTVLLRVTEQLADGGYRLLAEVPGTAGNVSTTPLVPVDYVAGLHSARLTDILIAGEDAEDTASLRKRYFDSVESQPFGGNIADYREKALQQSGVGGAKVIPLWNGVGTVKVLLQSALFGTPSATLIEAVQQLLDPQHGQGLGLAPIGHSCTVAGAEGAVVDVGFTLSLKAGAEKVQVLADAKEAVAKYFVELAVDWASSDHLVVRLSHLETRLLELEGVLDVQETTLNGSSKNLRLNPQEIPIRGQIDGQFA